MFPVRAALRLVVSEWVLSWFDDPCQGVRREPSPRNPWIGRAPELAARPHHVVGAYKVSMRAGSRS